MSLTNVRGPFASPTEGSYAADGSCVTDDARRQGPDNYCEAAPGATPRSLNSVAGKISPQEEEWLLSNPLKPAVSYKGGTVVLKMAKPEFSGERFMRNIIPYDIHLSSGLVETSFDFRHNGRHYFFTATRVTKFGKTAFNPVFTELTEEDWDASDGEVGIQWRLVPAEESKSFLEDRVVREKLSEVLGDMGLETPLEDYIGEVEYALGGISAIRGFQKFDVNTGIYVYEQYVEASDPILGFLVRTFGGGDIRSAALKVAYLALGEPSRSGKEGEWGPEVAAMDGSFLSPGP